MYILNSQSGDSYFNVALEEYLLKSYSEDFFIIAVNDPTIIIGVNQNTYDEINALYVKQNSVKVVRRLSGGGAVFQDRGNLVFSSIHSDDDSALIDFSKVSAIISGFLKEKLNLDTSFSGRNDIVLDNRKVSGQARHKFENKILHHGTILLSSNKKCLTDALKFNPERYADRALRSNHERVTNINEHLPETVTMEKFRDLFINYVRSCFPEAKMLELSHDDIDNINALVKEKYSTWEWNYGNKPDYNFSNSVYSKNGNVDLYLNLEEDIITGIRVFGDFFSQKEMSEIENALVGTKCEKEAIKAVISGFDMKCYMEGVSTEEFVACFFK
jgi:lipoate-protein ligase A